MINVRKDVMGKLDYICFFVSYIFRKYKNIDTFDIFNGEDYEFFIRCLLLYL